jgi:hypothetical protein
MLAFYQSTLYRRATGQAKSAPNWSSLTFEGPLLLTDAMAVNGTITVGNRNFRDTNSMDCCINADNIFNGIHVDINNCNFEFATSNAVMENNDVKWTDNGQYGEAIGDGGGYVTMQNNTLAPCTLQDELDEFNIHWPAKMNANSVVLGPVQ